MVIVNDKDSLTFPHRSHICGFSPEWTRICTVKADRCMKGLPHPFSGQTWGLSPVWILSAYCISTGLLNVHGSHTMTSEVTSPSETFAAICACESLYGTVATMSLGIIKVIWCTLVLMLMWHVHILEWSLCVVRSEQ